ncbi:arsenate reductase [Legionella wadsworthii]|uniref:Arsenate reductase n=2 Tax=Legionella wadsworthii TaxID=28088 RepID=A0A378LUE2_9GAMM|nr:arsenate reductase [Legionella wadsworthii]
MYAIPNCDTVKKARIFLEKNHINYEFIDFKKNPPTKAQIQAWADDVGELPINKKGTTYRKHKDLYESLSAPQKMDFIIENTSLIKRPVLVENNRVIAIGFDEDHYKNLIKNPGNK